VHLQVAGVGLYLVYCSFLVCRFFAGYFCVFCCKSLIINGIHFSGSLRVKLWLLKGKSAFAGSVCLYEPLICLILLIHMKWADMLVRCGHIWFIVYFCSRR
jgi:hypothetical protein